MTKWPSPLPKFRKGGGFVERAYFSLSVRISSASVHILPHKRSQNKYPLFSGRLFRISLAKCIHSAFHTLPFRSYTPYKNKKQIQELKRMLFAGEKLLLNIRKPFEKKPLSKQKNLASE